MDKASKPAETNQLRRTCAPRELEFQSPDAMRIDPWEFDQCPEELAALVDMLLLDIDAGNPIHDFGGLADAIPITGFYS